MARGSGLSIDSDPASSSFFLSNNPIVLKDAIQPHMDSSIPFFEMDFFSNNNNLRPAPSNADSSTPSHHLHFKVNTGLNLLTTNTDEYAVDDELAMYSNFREKLAKIRTEIAVVRAELEEMMMMGENHNKLKDMLNEVNTDYNALKMQINSIESRKGGEYAEKHENNVFNDASPEEKKKTEGNRGNLVPRKFIDIGLASINEGDQANNVEPSLSSCARRSSDGSRSPLEVECSAKIGSEKKEINKETKIEQEADRINQTYSPPKNVDDQVDAIMKKARVAIKAFSEAPMITDGCQWRKYGQKMAKGNPCPRAYYRCTMGTSCPVKKQVQRCAEDRSILVTTYEGNHNHALPPTAMAMAQMTAAAVRTSLSGSMSSNDGLMNGSFLTRTTLLPCSSSNIATLSASAPFPTITLDLTNPPTAQAQPSTQFQVPLSNNNASHVLTQVLAQALYSNNQSSFSGLQMNNNDPLPLSAIIAANPNFTRALTAAITSSISALPKNVNGDNIRSLTASGNNNDSNFAGN